MKRQYDASKKKQLQSLSDKLSQLLKSTRPASRWEIDYLIGRITQLLNELARTISHVELKKLLGGVAIYFALVFASPVNAQQFDAPVQNPFGLTPTYLFAFPTFADLDDDGDMDLLAGEYSGAFKFYENIGSADLPEFATPQLNPFGLDSIFQWSLPSFADIDSDGDLDLFAGDNDGRIQFFANVGSATEPAFAEVETNPFGLTTDSNIGAPVLVDIDGDGDLDLFMNYYYESMLYYENMGTASEPEFGTVQVNPFGIGQGEYYYVGIPTFADLDMDGDLDMLTGWGYFDGFLIYHENVGSINDPVFAEGQISPFGLTYTSGFASPAFVDLDADGDMDLLVGEYAYEPGGFVGNFAYFENTGSSAINSPISGPGIQVFPNPVSDMLSVKTRYELAKIDVYDVSGQILKSFHQDLDRLDFSEMLPGIYTIMFTRTTGKTEVIKTVKQ